jgi:NarL family two-component system sensor histidine kinase LiaS
LHDSVSQSLFSINLSARALRGLVRDDPEAAISGLSELEGAAKTALAEMRALLAQLRAPQVEPPEVGGNLSPTENAGRCDLVAGLASYCEQLRLEIGSDGRPPLLDVELDLPRGLLLPEGLYHQVIQIAREALHNVIKHAGVRRAVCELRHEPEGITLVVSDQGCGFEPEDLTTGYGLKGMRERVEAIGGKIEVISKPGAGARLRIDIPHQEVKE